MSIKAIALAFCVAVSTLAACGSNAHPDAQTRAPGFALPREARALVRLIVTLQQLGAGEPLALLPYAIDL